VSHKVLVVEDEPSLLETLEYNLERQGYVALTAADGLLALEVARRERPDLIILDVMLPGLDGFEVCRILRQEMNVPIIMLTARDDEASRVTGLEMGADDYVTKPFSPPELVARVRAAVRRYRGSQASADHAVLRAGGLVLDPAAHEVSVDGEPVVLTAKEFAILEVMMCQPGIVLTRRQILDAAWGFSDFVDERGVDVHVRHLREKLGDDAASPRFIETVRGVGYRFKKDAR